MGILIAVVLVVGTLSIVFGIIDLVCVEADGLLWLFAGFGLWVVAGGLFIVWATGTPAG